MQVAGRMSFRSQYLSAKTSRRYNHNGVFFVLFSCCPTRLFTPYKLYLSIKIPLCHNRAFGFLLSTLVIEDIIQPHFALMFDALQTGFDLQLGWNLRDNFRLWKFGPYTSVSCSNTLIVRRSRCGHIRLAGCWHWSRYIWVWGVPYEAKPKQQAGRIGGINCNRELGQRGRGVEATGIQTTTARHVQVRHTQMKDKSNKIYVSDVGDRWTLKKTESS